MATKRNSLRRRSLSPSTTNSAVPKKEEIDNVFLIARVMYKAVLGLHYHRQQQKKDGQLAIF